MSAITTHILDTARGRPAAGVDVVLEARNPAGAFAEIARGQTNDDGRVKELGPSEAELAAGTYRIVFATGAYFESLGVPAFYPEVSVVFEVAQAGQHYHVPLLLSPFGYSTYRGS